MGRLECGMGYIMKRLVNLLKINGVKVTVITEGIIAVMIAVYIRFKLHMERGKRVCMTYI